MIVLNKNKKYIKEKTDIGTVLLMTFSVLFTGYVLGQDKISISSSVDKRNIKIGDIIHYRVKVVHNKNIEVNLPGMGANLGGFEIRDYKKLEPRKEAADIISEVEYSISTFTTGKFVIPPLGIQYKEPGDTVYKQLSTRKIEINVVSMKPSEEGDIRDIKDPVELPYLWWEVWGKWAALGLGVLSVLVGALLVYRRKKQGKSIIPRKIPPPRPAHEIALESLDRIKDSDLLEHGDIKTYYTEISEIIRTYFEGRFYIPALERTSREIMEELTNIIIDPEVYELITDLLITSDMVKFAKVIPEPETHKKILQSAYTIVNKTKVLPVGETEEETEKSDRSSTDSEKAEAAVKEEKSEEVNLRNEKASEEGEK